MKRKLATTYLVIGMMLAPVVGNTADSDSNSDTDRSGPVIFVKDSVITTKIKIKLAAKSNLGSLKDIKVDTDKNGVVSLSGTVQSQAEADKAVAIAQDTKGVVTVLNDIKILQPN